MGLTFQSCMLCTVSHFWNDCGIVCNQQQQGCSNIEKRREKTVSNYDGGDVEREDGRGEVPIWKTSSSGKWQGFNYLISIIELLKLFTVTRNRAENETEILARSLTGAANEGNCKHIWRRLPST